MLKQILCLTAFIISGNSFAQSFHIVKIDSVRWRLEQRIPSGQGGGGTINLSDFADSATIIARFTSLVESRKKAIDEKVLEKEYQQLDAELKRATGRSFEDQLKDRLAGEIVGNWDLVYGDTLAININKAFKVTGGRVRGEAQVLDKDRITLTNVLPGPVTMTRTGKNLAGTLSGKPVLMIKAE